MHNTHNSDTGFGLKPVYSESNQSVVKKENVSMSKHRFIKNLQQSQNKEQFKLNSAKGAASPSSNLIGKHLQILTPNQKRSQMSNVHQFNSTDYKKKSMEQYQKSQQLLHKTREYRKAKQLKNLCYFNEIDKMRFQMQGLTQEQAEDFDHFVSHTTNYSNQKFSSQRIYTPQESHVESRQNLQVQIPQSVNRRSNYYYESQKSLEEQNNIKEIYYKEEAQEVVHPQYVRTESSIETDNNKEIVFKKKMRLPGRCIQKPKYHKKTEKVLKKIQEHQNHNLYNHPNSQKIILQQIKSRMSYVPENNKLVSPKSFSNLSTKFSISPVKHQQQQQQQQQQFPSANLPVSFRLCSTNTLESQENEIVIKKQNFIRQELAEKHKKANQEIQNKIKSEQNDIDKKQELIRKLQSSTFFNMVYKKKTPKTQITEVSKTNKYESRNSMGILHQFQQHQDNLQNHDSDSDSDQSLEKQKKNLRRPQKRLTFQEKTSENSFERKQREQKELDEYIKHQEDALKAIHKKIYPIVQQKQKKETIRKFVNGFKMRMELQKYLNFLHRHKLKPSDFIGYRVTSQKPYEKIWSYKFFDAVYQGNIEKCEEFLKANRFLVYDINHVGMTPLILACKKQNLKMAKFLIEAGSFLDEEDFLGRTALYFAISTNNIDIYRLLLVNRASPWSSQQDYEEMTKKIDNISYYSSLVACKKIHILLKLVPIKYQSDMWRENLMHMNVHPQ